MAPISESIEINRKPEDVFAYLDDVERHGEWQEQIVAAERQDDGLACEGNTARARG